MNEREMLAKLGAIKDHYVELGKLIIDPEVIADTKQYVKYTKEYKDLEPVANAYDNYKLLLDNIDNAKEIIKTEKDDDFKEMAKAELEELMEKKEEIESEIKIMLIPKDPEDERNAILFFSCSYL